MERGTQPLHNARTKVIEASVQCLVGIQRLGARNSEEGGDQTRHANSIITDGVNFSRHSFPSYLAIDNEEGNQNANGQWSEVSTEDEGQMWDENENKDGDRLTIS